MSDASSTAAAHSPRDRRRELEALLRKKAEQSRSFPLSFVQQRMWVLDQLDPGNPVYIVPLAMRVRGALDVDALTRTLNELVVRHETLRTRIAVVDAQAVQVVEAPARQKLAIVDLEHIDPARREAEAIARATAEVRRPFRLDQAPLLRVLLLRLSPVEHILVVALHHIISDDWSLGALVREVALLYQALRAGRPSPLEPLPIQYADYAAWQRQHLQGATLQGLLDYWQPRMQNVPPLELPADHPHSFVGRQAGATETLLMPKALADKLRETARREGATLYMILLAAYQVLLYRYSGQEDFGVGSPIAGRIAKETEGLVGCFVNTLVFRATLDKNATFRQVLRQVRNNALEAFQHQEMPFERLVEALNPDRDTGRHPLFQATFTLQSAPWPELRIADINIAAIPLDTGTSKFDMSFVAREQPDGLSVHAEFASPLFERGTVVRLLRHFHSLLEGIAADADRPISRIPLLSEVERRQLLVEWNNTERHERQASFLHQLIEAQVKRSPLAVAVECEGRQLSYDELNSRANQLAHHLIALGVGPETRVGICLERSAEMVIALLAVLKAGGAYVPLDPDYPSARLTQMLADASPMWVVSTDALRDRLHGAAVLALDGPVELAAIGRAPTFDPTDRERTGALLPEHPAYVIFTSGSTGTPKGVVVTHAGIPALASCQAERLGLSSNSRALQFASFNFDASLSEIAMALTAGAALVLVPDDARSGPALREMLIKERVTHATLPPIVLATLGESAGLPLEALIVAGEACPGELVARWSKTLRMINGYGPTETTVCATMSAPLSGAEAPPIGTPIWKMRVYVLDAELQPAPVGVAGDLYVAGTGLARGYLNRPGLTADRFVADPYASRPGARMYRTGDRARWRADGNLEFLGRADQQVKVRGFRIEPGEVQAALLKHPAVREAAVIAFDAGPGGKELAVYWVAGDSGPQAEELRVFLQKYLPDYMIPTVFVPLESLPVSLNGKIDFKALPAPVRQRDSRREFVTPRTPEEEWLAALWREVLHVDEVGVHDHFFTLGGHSLLATQVLLRINREFNLHIPLRDLFEAVTIEKLGQRIATARLAGTDDSLPPIRPAPRDGLLPMTYNQEPFWISSYLQQGPAPYAFHSVLRIEGALDVAAMEGALNEIVRRHEPLRTTFVERGDVLVQHIAPYEPWKLKVVDLSQLSAEMREDELRRYAKAESERPIDLATGPLLRLELLKLSENEHAVLVGKHHIMYDGWSLEVLSREMVTAYFAMAFGLPSPLVDLPIQYADFAVWQRERLQGEVLEKLRGYWLPKLQGLPVLELPIDRPRPPLRTTHGAICERALPGPLSQAVRDLSKQAESTTFMTMLTAFEVLMHRYSGQEDFGVSTPVAGRLRPETESLIGCFINDLVLRADLSGDPSFRQLLARVRETVLEAFDHQEMPFTRLIQELNPPRDPSRCTLVQTELILHHVPPASAPVPGLELSDVRGLTATEGADSELALVIYEEERGYQLRFCYQSDLFEEPTIARMAEHFEAVLEAAIAYPDRPLSQLSLPEVLRPELARRRELAANGGARPVAIRPPYLAPRSDAERTLAALWARLLGVDSVGVNDDFFERGGHSLLSVRMMAQACAALGAELPLASFVASPTIAGLAAHYQKTRPSPVRPTAKTTQAINQNGRHSRSTAAPVSRSLVSLRTGGPANPLYCIHGVGGHVASFWSLARGLADARSVYGVQGLGLQPGEQPHGRIADMAAAYWTEIEAMQPCGPYLLAGWSMGGLIALETARRIIAAGEEVALVALFDTVFSVRDVAAADMDDQMVLDWLAPRLGMPVAELKRIPLDRQWQEIAARAKVTEGDGLGDIRRLADVCVAHLAALADHSPAPYEGAVVLFQPRQRAGLDPRWRTLCPLLRMEQVSGNHYTMLRPPHVEGLAQRLGCYLPATAKANELARAR